MVNAHDGRLSPPTAGQSEVPAAIKEEIYPGEPRSVDTGIELARGIIWGPPGGASHMLKDADLTDPMMAALSRYVADRAN